MHFISRILLSAWGPARPRGPEPLRFVLPCVYAVNGIDNVNAVLLQLVGAVNSTCLWISSVALGVLTLRGRKLPNQIYE